MSTEALSARDLTNHLVAQAALTEHAPDRAAHIACDVACQQLTRSLGPIGFNGLFTRALVQAEVAHPLLREFRLARGSASSMPDITDIVANYGPQPVADALRAALVAMFELLARLVGMDVVVRLVEREPLARVHDAEDGR